MRLEKNNQSYVEENITGILPFSDRNKEESASDARIYDFIKSFEGIYVTAGKESREQVSYVVKKALTVEGILPEEEALQTKMIGTITDMLMADPHVRESVEMVIQRFGK